MSASSPRATSALLSLLLAAGALSGCAKRMTVREYVLSKLPRNNPGFEAAMEAAQAGQAAFNLNADTLILEIRDDSEVHRRLADLLSKSRDAYRRAMSYRFDEFSSSLQPLKDNVQLTDVSVSRTERVPLPGLDIRVRVQASSHRVDVASVESARGLPVLHFDASLNPKVTREFQPYLVGDQVDVAGDIKQTIRR